MSLLPLALLLVISVSGFTGVFAEEAGEPPSAETQLRQLLLEGGDDLASALRPAEGQLLFDVREPLPPADEVGTQLSVWWWVAMAVGLGLLLGLLLWLLLGRRARPEKDAYGHLCSRLDHAEKYLTAGDLPTYCNEASLALRTYIEFVLGIPATSRTSEEFLTGMPEHQLLADGLGESLAEFLKLADRARYHPAAPLNSGEETAMREAARDFSKELHLKSLANQYSSNPTQSKGKAAA